jgi:hypothetical protein
MYVCMYVCMCMYVRMYVRIYLFIYLFICLFVYLYESRSQWPRGLRRGSADDCLLGLGIRNPPGAWMSVSCECCVLSGRGLCAGPLTRPEESYRVI